MYHFFFGCICRLAVDYLVDKLGILEHYISLSLEVSTGVVKFLPLADIETSTCIS